MPIATNDKGDAVFLDSDGAWKPATLAEHPETKQRLAYDGSTWTPLPSKISTGEAVGRGITQGFSFGLRDEGQGLIEAGGGSPTEPDLAKNIYHLGRGAYLKLTGDPEAEARYKAAVERERAATKQIERERPGAYLGGNVLGAVAMPVGFAARAPTFASRVAAGAKTGAVAGGLTGFGEGEGLGGSLKGAAIGAPVGGVVGGASVPAVEGLVRGAGALASYPVSVARGLLTPGAASERAIGNALVQAERSDPTGINRITQRQFGAGPGEAVVGDVLGEPGRKLARSAANISPEARETMNQALNARGEAQGARAITWLDSMFSFPNARAQQEALDATRRSATNAAYQAAERQGAGGLWSPELERLASSQGVSDAMRTAVRTSQDEAVRRGMGGFNPKISFTPDGRIQFNRGPTGVPTYPDLRYWDQVRRELSDAAMKAGRGTEENMRLGGLAAALNTELDQLVPAYQTARRTAAGFFDARDALEAGQNFATQKFGANEARAALAQMNTTERALFRDGFISRLKDQLGATRDVRDITKIFGASQESRDKLVVALGPQRAREFQAMLHAESIMQKLKEAVQGNSSTVMQLLGAGAAGAAGGGYFGFDPTTSGISSALAGGLKKGADANMARHITRLMMSRDPAVLQAGIRQLARNARNLEVLQSLNNTLSRIVAQQGAERIPGRQYGGPVEERQSYLVGERGPEVFVPDRPGTIVPTDEPDRAEVQRYLAATTQNYPKFGPGGIPINPAGVEAMLANAPESSNIEDRRDERGAFAAAAARTARAARPPGGRSEGAGTRFVEGGYGIPSAYRALNEEARKAFAAGTELTWGADPQAAERAAGTVVQQALGATVAPLVAPAQAGAVLGAGAIRRGKQAVQETVEATAPSGKRQAITATSLRQRPMDEAIDIARSGQHLIPKKEGGFVGAPYWVRNEQDLAKMRADFDTQAVGGVPGANWYQRAQEGNRIMAGPDPARQHLLAGEQALWSAQSTPDTNLGALLSAHNAYEAGKPLEIARTGQQARTYKKARDEGTSIPLGAKTGIYGQHLDPTRSSPTTGTNDIWHARAFNYRTPEGAPWDRALTPQQHAFMDAETVLAVDRANRAKLGGRTDWTPGEIQAAPWITGKAKGLMEKFGWSEQKAMEEATKTYNDYFPKYTAHATYEATPGMGTGHLPNLPTASFAEREAFAADPRSSWTGTTPGRDKRDAIYDALGMYQRETQPATGIYQSPGGPLEINPANVARPMVGFTGETGARRVDPASRAMMTGAEAARAYIDAQNAGAWSMPILNQRGMTSLSIPTDRPLSLMEIGQLRNVGAKAGLGDVVDYGGGSMMTSFYPGPPAAAELSKNLKSGLSKDVERITGVKPERATMDSGYVGYEEALKKPGSGAATKILEEALTSPEAPAMLAKLDKDPVLRGKVLDRLDRDAAYAAKTGQPVREDITRAREIISREGFSGLFEARRAGVSLPALAAFAPVVAYLRGGGQDE